MDILRVQETGVAGKQDEDVLDWAAQNSRVLLTHDVNMLLLQACKRIDRGLLMSGVIAVSQSLPIGTAIEDILLIAECTDAEDWKNQIKYLPL